MIKKKYEDYAQVRAEMVIVTTIIYLNFPSFNVINDAQNLNYVSRV